MHSYIKSSIWWQVIIIAVTSSSPIEQYLNSECCFENKSCKFCEVEVSQSLHSRNLEGASPHPLGKRTTSLTSARRLAYHVPTTFSLSISNRLAVLTLLSGGYFSLLSSHDEEGTITSLFLHVSRTYLILEVSAIKNSPARENSTVKTKRALEEHP